MTKEETKTSEIPADVVERATKTWNEILKSADDRTAAIMGAAILDDLMEQALACRMRDNRNTKNLLNRASANVRIQIAHAIGLIGDMYFEDLTHVNMIRNCFAHRLLDQVNQPITFASPNISDLCAKFKCGPELGLEWWPDDARGRFLRTATILTNDLFREIRFPDSPRGFTLSKYCDVPKHHS